jgi:hypothetical protein
MVVSRYLSRVVLCNGVSELEGICSVEFPSEGSVSLMSYFY